MQAQLTQTLGRFTRELRQELGDELVSLILYGSHARGDAKPDSDVDLFVTLRHAPEALQKRVYDVAYRVMWDADFSHVFSLYIADVQYQERLRRHRASYWENVEREGRILWPSA